MFALSIIGKDYFFLMTLLFHTFINYFVCITYLFSKPITDLTDYLNKRSLLVNITVLC